MAAAEEDEADNGAGADTQVQGHGGRLPGFHLTQTPSEHLELTPRSPGPAGRALARSLGRGLLQLLAQTPRLIGVRRSNTHTHTYTPGHHHAKKSLEKSVMKSQREKKKHFNFS